MPRRVTHRKIPARKRAWLDETLKLPVKNTDDRAKTNAALLMMRLMPVKGQCWAQGRDKRGLHRS